MPSATVRSAVGGNARAEVAPVLTKFDACAARLDALDSRLGFMEAQGAAGRVGARGSTFQ